MSYCVQRVFAFNVLLRYLVLLSRVQLFIQYRLRGGVE